MTTERGDDDLDFATLNALRGDDDGYNGPLDHPCPLCGPERESEYNQTRPVLRTWRLTPIILTYYCARCGAKGAVEASLDELLNPRPRPQGRRAQAPRTPSGNLHYVERLWAAANPNSPAIGSYFRFRHIAVEHVPAGAFRFHSECPWLGKKVACFLARYSDAATGELRGLWRRSADGLNKPTTLGPMGGCVIELWPRKQVGKRLVIGEGVETALAAATRITHHGKPLHPAWATGCAGNMRRFPVLDGIKDLVILVDNDTSGTGQEAAAECERRWREAGRRVTCLLPPEPGTDFNDLVVHHDKRRRR